MGHVVRCRVFATALRDRGVAVAFVMTGQLDQESGFVVEPAPGCGFEGGLLQPEDAGALISAARRHGAPAVLVDHYGADEQYLSALKKSGLRVAVIDDIGDRNLLAADWLLNQNISANRFEYHVRPDCEMLMGPRYALLRPQFREARARLTRMFSAEDRHVLITFGGGDVTRFVIRTLRALADSPLRLEVRCLAGAGYGDAKLRQGAAESPHKVELFGVTNDVAPHMTWADLSINAGGISSWELCCLGVPMLVTTLAFNQQAIAEGLAERGIARRVPSPDGERFDNAVADSVLTLLMEPKERQRMSDAGCNLVDGGGAERAAASFCEFFGKR
jgi:UDP-2,4-diacetamido-2,4,6-trideoxy-beta-L-altropyranose hydrolase